ncbi:MAG: hypothetical protein LBG89_02090 [Rickettsiales bacterium]|nr:hypothetical protein [Rickettsiales bacterium]
MMNTDMNIEMDFHMPAAVLVKERGISDWPVAFQVSGMRELMEIAKRNEVSRLEFKNVILNIHSEICGKYESIRPELYNVQKKLSISRPELNDPEDERRFFELSKMDRELKRAANKSMYLYRRLGFRIRDVFER